MNIRFLSVVKSGAAVGSRPRITLSGEWLAEMGFVKGALVQALPEKGGMAFNLRDENIQKYDVSWIWESV